MSFPFKRLARVGAAAGIATLAGAVLTATNAYAATTNGTATIIDALGNPITASQPGSTNFSFSLSSGGNCSGDSASSGYHWYSYIEPQGYNAGNLTLVNGTVSPGSGLYNSAGVLDGNNHNTDVSTGHIILPSDYNFIKTQGHVANRSFFAAGQTTAVYEVGIVCMNSAGTATDWWNNEVTFTGTTASFTWTNAPGPVASANIPEVPLAVGLPLSGAAVLGGGAFLNRRRSRRGTATHAA